MHTRRHAAPERTQMSEKVEYAALILILPDKNSLTKPAGSHETFSWNPIRRVGFDAILFVTQIAGWILSIWRFQSLSPGLGAVPGCWSWKYGTVLLSFEGNGLAFERSI